MKTEVVAVTAKEQKIRRLIVGVDEKVPTLSGLARTYINFDNAASTPVLKPVLETLNEFMPWYSSVHRGSGFKSQLSTKAYDDARMVVRDFFGANAAEHIVIFGKNTTEAINKLSYRLGLSKDDIVLVGLTEHHSNDLPWRAQATVKHIEVDKLGNLSLDNYRQLLKQYAGKLKLITISGGSNVTGQMPDIHLFAKLAHEVGAPILIDCAQLAPHRRINMRGLGDPEHLDYIVVSAHKMYAPFGTGALVGRKDTFAQGAPELCGGGTIKVVTQDRVEWADAPDRDEAGSPNVVGAVTFAKALKIIEQIGMDVIAEHEARLTAYLLTKLAGIPSVEIYGDVSPGQADKRLGVVAFNIKGIPHALVAAILGAEWGIGVRNGCFCAQPYVIRLLGIKGAGIKSFASEVMANDRSHMPGMVRISFGMYNTTEEVDILIDALEQIAAGSYEGRYSLDKRSGEYQAQGWSLSSTQYFSLS